jgi:hypothetical protein
VAKVAILAAVQINRRRVERRLIRAGYTIDGARVSRTGEPHAVLIKTADLVGLGDVVLDPAARSLGFRPRDGIECELEGRAQESPAWPMVVDIARAVAKEVPLAVLDDGAGTSYLIHPGRGLVVPPDYDQLGSSSTGDFLRRMLGNGRNRR